jgi:hypothetical protein
MKATWEYTNAASINQAGFFLRRRYPYPKYVVLEPVLDPGKTPVELGESIARQVGAKYDGFQETIGMQFTDLQTGGTIYGNTLEEVKANLAELRESFMSNNHRNMRGELIRLSTDLEGDREDLQSFYREALEAAIESAKICNLFNAVSILDSAKGFGNLINKHHLWLARSSTKQPETFISMDRLEKINDLALKAIVEELSKNCNCRLEGG